MKKINICLLIIIVACFWAAIAQATPNEDPKWVSPSVMAVKRVSEVPAAQHEPDFLNNLDCTLVDFRLVTKSELQTGCFVETALGLMDSDYQTMIYNGTDEGLALRAFSPNQVLVSWPKAAELLALNPVPTGGTYISLYKNPLLGIQDQRDFLLRLVAKQITRAPDIQLTDPAGQRLVINPQTIAFADNGSWLVAETLNGAFIRINLATLEMKAFARSYAAAGVPALFKSQVAISHDGRYVAINNEEYKEFRVYDLSTCGGARPNLQPETCQFYDYRPFVTQKIPGLQAIKHVRFVNEGLLSFEVRANNPANDGIYELAPTASIDFLIDYLGLGDSYTSGEGAFNYLSGTDTADNACHLSAHSYPLLISSELFSSMGGHSVACSGAVIEDVGSLGDTYQGQVRGVANYRQLEASQPALLNAVITNFVPGYISQNRFVQHYQPRIMTVSVAGNDVGFGEILEQCLVPRLSKNHSDNDCFNTYEDRVEVKNLVDRTVNRWVYLFRRLKRVVPGTRLYAVGYPDIIDDQGDCALNVNLSQGELAFAKELVVYINNSMHRAATEAEITYVDISNALEGHRLCETVSPNIAVNGVTAGTDIGILGINVFAKESYHPNALGQQLIKQAILKQTKNLTITPSIPDKTSNLAKGPKTGRPVNVRVPSSKTTPKVAKKGRSTPVKTKSTATLKPKTPAKVRLDGPNGPVLGSVDTDEEGDIDTVVTIPDTTTPGGHTIDVTGPNQTGEPVDITQPIYVPVSDNDFDGDGLPNTSDSCPTAVNSGQDGDHDGIDDVCDGYIGQSSSSYASITSKLRIKPATSLVTISNKQGSSYSSELTNFKQRSNRTSSTLYKLSIKSRVGARHKKMPYSRLAFWLVLLFCLVLITMTIRKNKAW